MENINLIRKIAWTVHCATGEELDDLLQEGMLAYYQGLKTYDPNKGKLSTYMWHVVMSRLKNYAKVKRKQKYVLCDDIECHAKQTTVTNVYENIPPHLYYAMEVILNIAQELDVYKEKEARRKMRVCLFENGFTRKEVREVLRTFCIAFE